MDVFLVRGSSVNWPNLNGGRCPPDLPLSICSSSASLHPGGLPLPNLRPGQLAARPGQAAASLGRVGRL